jgi:uncharacterized protein (DUF2267 family)
MSQTEISTLDRSVENALAWVRQLRAQGNFADDAEAYSALRSVLHALRERLTVPVCASLGSQLPLVLRGVYYEGWKPESVPRQYRSQFEFLEAVHGRLRGTPVEADHACRAVFQLLEQNISPGEIASVRSQLPEDLEKLWFSASSVVRS